MLKLAKVGLPGTHSLLTSQGETGEGRFAGTHTLVASQHETGEGQFSGTHTLVASQKEPGEGRFAGTHSLVASQVEKVRDSSQAPIRSSSATPGTAQDGSPGHMHLSYRGMPREKGALRARTDVVASGNSAGEGRFAATQSVVAGGKGAGEGRFSTSRSVVASGNGPAEGRWSSSIDLVVGAPVIGAGRFAATGVAVGHNPGGAKAAGTGGFSCSVTILAYANSSALYPWTARHEQGGTTAPTLHIDGANEFAFNVKVLTITVRESSLRPMVGAYRRGKV